MYGPNLKVERKAESLSQDSAIAFNVSPYVPQMGPISLYAAEHLPNLVYMAQNIQTLELMLYGSYPKGKKMTAMAASGAPITLDHPLSRSDRVRFFLDPKTWFDHLAEYDFSFGTRIHGNIAALLGGTPALLLAHDSRTLELAEYHEIPHRTITSIEEDADAISLYAESDWNRLNKAHPDRWDSFAAFLEDHRLTHVYEEGQDASAFDERLAATEFPPPVRTLMGFSPEELYEMRRTVTDLEITAEGVERLTQFDLLLRHPRLTLQGFLLARPMPESQIAQARASLPQHLASLLLSTQEDTLLHRAAPADDAVDEERRTGYL
jgi:hypothetical protein